MIAIVCTLLSAAGFYFAFGLGGVWPLAWIAAVPVLWLAFGDTKAWITIVSAFAALALGATNILSAYAGVLPWFVLVLALAGPALGFAVSVRGAQWVMRQISPLAGVFAFAVFWTSFDYLASLGHDGMASSPAISQVGAPFLIQSVSVLGPWIVTFLLGLVPAGIAMSIRKGTIVPVAVAVAAFAINLGYGAWRVAEAPAAPSLRVGLSADDAVEAASLRADEGLALHASGDYAADIPSLAAGGAKLIVIPEKIVVLTPQWREDVIAEFRKVAAANHVEIVAGFDDRTGIRRNEALIFPADGSEPQAYFKRHMVTGLEDVFVPGKGDFVQADRTGVDICKDMDYPTMLRTDSGANHPTLLAVPAWDFGPDGWWHARLAILRGVENGFSLARSAKDGMLTLTDAYGRMIAMKRSSDAGMVTLIGALARGPGETPYQTLGDVFAYLCLAAGAGLIAAAALRRSPKVDN